MKNFKTGFDNYGLFPLGMEPLKLLEWVKSHGAEGAAFSGLDSESNKLLKDDYLVRMRQYAEDNDLYLEWGGGQHIPRDMESWAKKDVFEINKKAAREAAILGTNIIRSCSGGLMRWNPDSPPTMQLIEETAEALKSQRGMLEDHNVILAIETHFEFTTFELLTLFDLCDAKPGGCLGICLDTMNLLTMLEDPVCAVERILPWVVSTHIKDGGIIISQDGIRTFTTEIGKGIVDFKRILEQFSMLNHNVNLSIEDHGGDFYLPIFESGFLSEFPDLTVDEFSKLIRLSEQTRARMGSGENSILPRDQWAEVCEKRLVNGFKALRKIIESMK